MTDILTLLGNESDDLPGHQCNTINKEQLHLPGQANHLAVTINADIVKQKQAVGNGGYIALKFGKTHPRVYDKLTTDHPIDLVRYQVACAIWDVLE